MRPAWSVLCFGVLTWLGGSSIADQLPTRLYTTADGLPNNFVNCIRRDARGYLWMCTREGLARFDGYAFVHYGSADGLSHGSVTDLLVTAEDDYWVGTSTGLFRFRPSAQPRFTAYRSSSKPGAQVITALARDRSGTIWIGTQDGLYRMDPNGDPSRPPSSVDLSNTREGVRALLVDRNGTLWIAAGGLYRLPRDGRIGRVESFDPVHDLYSLIEDRDGKIWLGAGDGAYRLASADSGSPTIDRQYTAADGLKSGAPVLLQVTDGRFWIDSWNGLAELLPNPGPGERSIRPYASDDRLVFDGVRNMGEDREGNLWLGCTFGALRVARNGLVSYGVADGLGSTRVASIFEDHDGRMFALTTGSGAYLNRWDGRRFTGVPIKLPPPHALTGGWYQVMLSDHAGEWWIATKTGGLCRFPKIANVEDTAHWTPKACYAAVDGLPGRLVYRVFEDSRGDIWASTLDDSGLSRWDRASGRFVHYGVADGLPDPRESDGYPATAFREDRTGAVWIGSKNWLARYRQGKFMVFGQKNGLRDLFVYALHLDRAGRVWIGGTRGGLYRVDDPSAEQPRFRSYGLAQGLSGDLVQCVTEDHWGRIYVCTSHGVDRLEPDSPDDPIRIRHYTVADGLAMGDLQEAFCDRTGTLWFGTLNGLSSLIPEKDTPRSPPPVLITGLQIRGERRAVSDLGETRISLLKLAPGQNQVRLDFVGLGFGTGEVLRYQYKLEGADADWSPPTEQRTLSYANLAPGAYRFLVRALNSSGQTSQEPASVEFAVLGPVWRRWWFVTFCAIAVAAAVYGIYRYQLAQALVLERMRTRIATDLHDDIGSSLSQIAIMSELAKRGGNGAAVSEIANLSRDLVDAMGEIVWAINPRHDHVSNLLHRMRRFATDALEARDIAMDFRTAGMERDLRATAEVRRQVFLIFKEGIANIARHAQARHVAVTMEVAGRILKLSLQDDGRGFDPLQARDGNGLLNMPARARSIGGTLEVASQSGRGTTLVLTVPLPARNATRAFRKASNTG